jgi:hypothetical protein
MGKLGHTLLACALGPVNYAGSCIMASRVQDGLQELSAESLSGGLQRGVNEVAKRVGIPSAAIDAILPQQEIHSTLAYVGQAHGAAMAAWALHAGHIGGLMQGVADLTVDGRAPDPSLCLTRLARKVHRDRAFSEPLQALADAVGAWQDLLERCRALVDDGRAIADAYKRRRMRFYLGISAGLTVACLFGLVGVFWYGARLRVANALESGDPCAAERVSAGDLAKASSATQEKAASMLRACQADRAEAARVAAERAQVEAQKKEAERRRAEHEATCSALAEHVESGRLSSAELEQEGGAILGRIANGTLDGADFGPEDPKLPCGDVGAGKRLDAAFERAVARSTAWGKLDDPSPRVRAALKAHASELASWPVHLIAARAEQTAKRAVLRGEPELITRASHLCELEEALGTPPGAACRTLGAVVQKR